jgi:hypothetical protein
MNVRRTLLATVVIAAASAGAAQSAQAQYGVGGCAGGYGYGFGAWDVGRLYGVLAENVPHFAAFPPVYYSVPVPRTYGYSPFAYPPGVMTPEVVEEAAPLSIVNPYFSGSAATAEVSEPATAPADRTTSVGPRVILNPYYNREAAAIAAR